MVLLHEYLLYEVNWNYGVVQVNRERMNNQSQNIHQPMERNERRKKRKNLHKYAAKNKRNRCVIFSCFLVVILKIVGV